MRYWNSWGYENTEKPPLTDSALAFVKETLGQSKPLPEATLAEVCAQVPPSRLPPHPLIQVDEETRVRHARGQSLPDWIAIKSGRFEFFPDGVAFPATSEQIQELLALSRIEDFTVIPYGGGTSVVGHLTLIGSERPVLTLSLGRMTRLLDLNEESQIATFEPGVPGPMVEAQLASRGYTLGHYPQSFELSTLGGWVVSRSSGQQSLGYGRIEQLFAGGRLETFAGSLDIPAIPASSAGPDLREIIMGSEGRFGVLSEVKTRVSRAPEREDFIVVFFPGWDAALNFCRETTQQKIQLSMLRASSSEETRSQLKLAGHDGLVHWLERYLYMRGAGEDKSMVTLGITGTARQVKDVRRQVRSLIRSFDGVGMNTIGNKVGRLWEQGRFRYPYLRENLWKHGYAVDTLETSINWDQTNRGIVAIERALTQALERDGVRGEKVHCFTHLSHVYGQGSSLYTTYLFRFGATYEETLQRWKALKRACSQAVVEVGGTISHQHGVGRDHAPYLYHEKGELGMEALRSLSQHFDPDQRLNPGALLCQEALCTETPSDD